MNFFQKNGLLFGFDLEEEKEEKDPRKK